MGHIDTLHHATKHRLIMRLKLYYTTDEITNNLYTIGSEFATIGNVEYIGLYHKYSTGEIYTQKIWNSRTSKKLIKLQSDKTKDVTYQKLRPQPVTFDQPTSSIISIKRPQSVDIISRYFIKKANEEYIIEIDIIQYQKWLSKKIDPIMYNAISIQWKISGKINDEMHNGVLIKGVRSSNQLQINNANTTLQGISKYLTNPLQFYTDSDFTVPKDINK